MMGRGWIRVAWVLLAAWLCLQPALAAPTSHGAPAADPSPSGARAPLRVVVGGDPPFVRTSGGHVEGLSVRVWESVAEEAGIAYVIQRHTGSVDDALEALKAGKADVAVGPLCLTSRRAQSVSFTLPYFRTTLCIGALPVKQGLWGRVEPYLYGVGVFFAAVTVLLFIIGNLVWLLERHENPQTFPHAWLPGVANGMWLAVVTLTSVGYGDAVPRTGWGRLLAAAWMLLAMLFASTLTASIASVMTADRLQVGVIERPAQLEGRTVAVPGGGEVLAYVSLMHAKARHVPDMKSAVLLLESHEVDAILFYRPEMQYYAAANPDVPLKLSPITDMPSDYSFAFPQGSPLVDRVNVALLRLRETGELKTYEHIWLHGTGGVARPSALTSP